VSADGPSSTGVLRTPQETIRETVYSHPQVEVDAMFLELLEYLIQACEIMVGKTAHAIARQRSDASRTVSRNVISDDFVVTRSGYRRSREVATSLGEITHDERRTAYSDQALELASNWRGIGDALFVSNLEGMAAGQSRVVMTASTFSTGARISMRLGTSVFSPVISSSLPTDGHG
jgi:hypothetical protein